MVDKCAVDQPPLESPGPGREVACYRWKDISLERMK